MPVYPINYALGGMRANTFRCGYLSAKIFCYVDGVEREISDLSITERKGAGNTGRFIARGGWEPQGGEQVVIQQGTRNSIKRLFGGTIIAPNATNFEKPENRVVTANMADWTWAANGDLVIGTFHGTFDEIAIELMSRYAPSGFTTRKVQRGLPTVSNGIEITDAYLPVALKRLAERGPGIVQFIDYRQDLYFRNDGKRLSQPATVTAGNKTLKQFSIRRDYGQLVTRVYFEARGSTVLSDVVVGETNIPVLDASVFPSTGALAKSGTQRFAFSGTRLGGGGSLVGPGAAPSSAPVVALASGSGIESGSHEWAYLFVTLDGRTRPSPLAALVIGNIAAPTSTPVAGIVQSGAGPDDGVHLFAISHVTAAGETPPGPTVSATTSSRTVAAPVSAWSAGNDSSGSTLLWAVGDSVYIKPVYLAAGGETLPGAQSSTWVAAADPLNPPKSLDAFVSTVASGDAAVTGIRVYVNVNGSWIGYRDYANASATVGLSVIDSAGSPPGAATAIVKTQQVPLSNLEPSPALGTARKVWGTVAGGSQLKYIATINTTDTSYLVTTVDSGLGSNAPTLNTAAANRASVTVPAGPDGTTDIEVFRTEAGLSGAANLKKSFAVGSNTGGTYTDSTPDASLTTAAPEDDTSELVQPEGQVSAGSIELIVASPGDFEEAGGWAIIGNGRVCVRYGGLSATALTDIPETGPGSIEAPVAYNSQVTPAPELVGVTSGSPDLGSITYTIPRGQEINPVAQVDNLDAQALVRSIIGGHSGIKAYPIQNRSLSYEQALARAQAYLERRSQVPAAAAISSKDINFAAGTLATVSLEAPTSVDEELAVQAVTISKFHMKPPVDPLTERPFDYQPDRTIEASTELLSVEDLLRQDART